MKQDRAELVEYSEKLEAKAIALNDSERKDVLLRIIQGQYLVVDSESISQKLDRSISRIEDSYPKCTFRKNLQRLKENISAFNVLYFPRKKPISFG